MLHNLKQSILFRYLAFAKPYRVMLIVMALAGIVMASVPLLPPYIIRVLVNRVLENKAGLENLERQQTLLLLGAALVLIHGASTAINYQRSMATLRVISSISFDIRQALWRHLQRLSLAFHISRPTGSLLSRLVSDINVAQQMVNAGIIRVVIDTFGAVIAGWVLASLNGRLTLLVLAALPIYAILYRKYNPRIRQASRDVQEQNSVLSGTAVERLDGIAVVQTFAQEGSETRQFAAQADELRGRTIHRGLLNARLKLTGNFTIHLVTTLLWVVGGYMVIGGTMDTGKILQFAGTAALLYGPIQRFSDINITYQTSMAAIERVFAILDETPEVRNRPGALDKVPGTGTIQFDNVTFDYGFDPVLKDLDFTIRPGERVAIVGESGAGKSTLVALIPRLYDVTTGAVRIDGIDVRDYRLRRLRRSIGIVLQEIILFSGAVEENLRYGLKHASRAQVIEAAKAANADGFINDLPHGYDTVIGERGLTLSGGQRQRISLARTLLQNPRILILDEATSSLDSESENLINEAMQRVMVGRTCLIIAHRLSTVLNADRILVLKEGRQVEFDSHESLLERGGYYRYLFEQQFGPLQEMVARSLKTP